MKYHLLVYDAKRDKKTTESLKIQDIDGIDVVFHFLQKDPSPFKKGSLYAYYIEIMQIPDNEVIILLEGGNYLAHKYVLQEVNRMYTVKKAFMTYGGNAPIAKTLPYENEEIFLSDIMNRKAREAPKKQMNLKTFYSGLFKKIRLTDLLVDGFFPEEGYDYQLMLPMLEMSEDRAIFSKDILHITNKKNQFSSDKNLLSLHSYSVIDNIF